MIITEKHITEFKKYLIEEEKAAATVEKYVRDVSVFCGWCMGREVDKELVLRYKEHLCNKLMPASVNAAISSLNAFFEFAEEKALKIKILKQQRKIFAEKSRELTKSEYERLLEAAKRKRNPKLFYLMQTICSTGIRVSEDI